MKKSLILLFLFICLPELTKGQINLEVQVIPDSLKNNAYSVVRLDNSTFTWLNPETGDEQCTYIITILNEKGNDEANFMCYCDKFSDLKKFSGEIYDANGKLIRKIKKSELKFTEYFSGLASDSKTYYLKCNSPKYPFTVKYEWEVKHQKGIIGFPTFVPQSEFHQSIEKACYTINTPYGTDFKHKALNIHQEPKRSIYDKHIEYKWELENVTAIEQEPFGPSFTSVCPMLYVTPVDFSYDGTKGNMSTWESFGEWQYGLLSGRNILSEKLKQTVHELIRECKNDREKVKAIYEYLAKTTRYVSIQLGIGGLQPIPANEVCSAGFGDCKGLSNYMKAMLEEIGIQSCYTVISTRKRNLIKDFASANQMNHVILQVPLPQDTLWLECTNPQLPFGYIHSDIAGHEALLINKTGGKIHRLPTYPDSLNIENNQIDIDLSESGKISAKVNYKASLFQYESRIGFTKLPIKEQIDYLRRGIKLNQAKVSNLTITEDKNNMPSINISYDVDSEQYGNKTGNRLFIPVNTFREGFGKFNNKERKYDIFINYGYKDNDSLSITIPENFIVEALPKSVVLKKEYGAFYSSIIVHENKIIIKQSLLMKSGQYKATDYPAFIDFCKAVSNAYQSKIVLKKKTG